MLQHGKHVEIDERSSQDDSQTTRLYQRYAAQLLGYFCQQVTQQSDAEDLLLEVFLATWDHEEALGSMLEREQRTWLWRVARNKLVDHYRRSEQRRSFPLAHADEITDSDERMPEALALQNEEHALLHTYLKQLSTLQQEVLQLRFFAGLRCAEIATILNKREGAIRTLLSRTLNTLRSYYEQ